MTDRMREWRALGVVLAIGTVALWIVAARMVHG